MIQNCLLLSFIQQAVYPSKCTVLSTINNPLILFFIPYTVNGLKGLTKTFFFIHRSTLQASTWSLYSYILCHWMSSQEYGKGYCKEVEYLQMTVGSTAKDLISWLGDIRSKEEQNWRTKTHKEETFRKWPDLRFDLATGALSRSIKELHFLSFLLASFNSRNSCLVVSFLSCHISQWVFLSNKECFWEGWKQL